MKKLNNIILYNRKNLIQQFLFLHGFCTLGNSYQLVTGYIFEYIDSAADPTNFYPVYFFVFTQTEMKTRAVMALITPAAMNFVDLDKVSGYNLYMCSDTITVGFDPAEANLEPVVFVLCIVP